MDTGQFVQLFHGNAAAHFRIIKPGFARSLQGTLPEVSEVLRRHNDDQCGVYLVINRGGTRKKDISAVTAVFADFDDVPKPEILKRLAAPKLHPTLLVESRRGYHVYWLLDEPYTGIDRLEVFEKVQRGISSLLGSDPRIVSAEHLMALPGFLNWKDPASPFLVEVRECSGAVYSVTELKAAFSVEAEDGLDVKASVLAPVKGVHPEADPPQSQDQQERKGVLGGYKCPPLIIPPDTCTHPSCPSPLASGNIGKEQVIDFLRHLDLQQHLQLDSTNLLCPFHDDSTPSASLFQTETGEWLLKCHACHTHADIITIEQKKTGTTFTPKLMALMAQYGLTFQAPSLQANLQLLQSNAIETTYPNLHRHAHWYLPTLLTMTELAIHLFSIHGILDKEGRPLLVRSYRLLAKDLGLTSLNSTVRKLDNLAWFGLIHKLRNDEIPDHVFDQACQVGRHERRTTVWALPDLTPDYLTLADQRATQGRRDGESATSRTSREAQERAHGRSEAERLYPLAGNGLRLDAATAEVRKAAQHLLATKRYVHDAEVLEFLRWKTFGKRRLLKQCRVSVYGELGLQPVQTTKDMKERLRLESEGFPKIWIAPCTEELGSD